MNRVRLLAASAVFGLWTVSTTAAPLTPEDAAGHIGEIATVCSVVASTKYEANAQAQPTLFDLGKPSPNATFTAIMYGENRAKFGTPETSLRGKRHLCDGED